MEYEGVGERESAGLGSQRGANHSNGFKGRGFVDEHQKMR